jgi:ribonuclease D
MIEGARDLEELARACRQSSCVGLDTEFVWERTYYPRLGIVQVSLDDGSCHLIDVPAVGDLRPMGPVLEDVSIVKVLHDAPQDLTILRRETGSFALNIFDTRIAAGFCGYRASLSLQDLLRSAMEITLSKSETRTDWLRRPLSPRQVAYAVDDVKHLIPLREKLLGAAAGRGRDVWLQEELSLLDDPSNYEDRDPEEQFERIRGGGRLTPVETAVLRELAAWRERTARDLDLPRGHVVTDEVLVVAARRKPGQKGDLRGVRGLPPHAVERFGDGLVGAVRDGLLRQPVEETQDGRQPTPREDVRADFAMAYVRGKALDEGIDPSLVGTRNDVRQLVEGTRNGASENRLLCGWRRTFVGEDLLEILEGNRAVRLGGRAKLPRLA